MGPMLILACGSRHYTDRLAIRRALLNYWPSEDGLALIHGAARGADTLAAEEFQGIYDEASRSLGQDCRPAPIRAFPADWDRLGRAAGPARTRQMLDEQPGVVLAFGEGRGTDFAVTEARRRGIQVVRVP